MSRIGTWLAVAGLVALVSGSYASAAVGDSHAKTIKLSAVVQSVAGRSSGNKCRHAHKVTLRVAKKSGGSINITRCLETGLSVSYRGSATLKVGKLTGKVQFGAMTSPVPPKFKKDKTTAHFSKQAKTEDAHWNGDLPDSKGAHFTILLTDSVGTELPR